MILYVSFLHFFCSILPLAFSLPKSACPASCGNLTIPFPFGIGSDCSIDRDFDIRCNTSTNPPKAYLSSINLEIVEFSESESQIRVKYPKFALTCYNSSDSATERFDFKINLTETPYTLSDDNWLTAFGCDDFVTVFGNSEKSFGFGGGCLSICSDRIDRIYGVCGQAGTGSSNGCCQSPILAGTSLLTAYLSDSHRNWRENKLFPCSYAFVGEKQKDDWLGSGYRTQDLQNSTALVKGNPTVMRMPLVLDWRIGNNRCAIARNTTDFACRANNSDCNEAWHTRGYVCRCRSGYQGNPYLNNGCQDIDECRSESNPCASASTCLNIPGGYLCTCPKGYNGDGRRDGFGCRWSPSKLIITAIGVGVGIGSLLLLLMCYWLHKVLKRRANKKKKEKFFKRNGGLLLEQQTNEGTIGKTKLFPAKELEKATDNFNENRILGQGGQGTVYKGMLSNGQIVAIKKSKLVDEDQLEQFINEVAILSQINHRNVVKLLGCCLETEVPLLVYEFVPNGTLSDLIHDPSSEFQVSWNMRLKIAADIAGALAYLHSATSLPIYHRDIKTSNILLDEKYVVKVSDFGTSKSVTIDQTHVTTLVKGTFGYLDPEYFQSSQFTEKSDVYSFGVVLIELLTGKRAISRNKTEGLATRFLISMEKNCLDKILDDQVLGEGRKFEVVAVAILAQRCLNLQGKMRPTMKEVATELESVRMSQMPAALSVGDGVQEVRANEAKMMMLPDSDYSWTTSGKSAASSSTDCHPLMFATV